jgi:hypothetical protein
MGASEAAVDASMEAEAAVIKAAKRALKREESGSMKIKRLTKSLLEELDNNTSAGSYDKNTVRRCIEGSDSFVVDGKVVTLKKKGGGGGGGDGVNGENKKRKSSSAEEGGGDGVGDGGGTATAADRKAAKKAAKRAKKERKGADEPTTAATAGSTSAGASTGDDDSSIRAWRTQHKIVLRDSRGGEVGAAATKLISSNEDYRPYRTFDAPGCREKILGELIRQCTVANKFARPSPIQAQCWPVLLSVDPRTGRHRDAVGIAETGSGKGGRRRFAFFVGGVAVREICPGGSVAHARIAPHATPAPFVSAISSPEPEQARPSRSPCRRSP